MAKKKKTKEQKQSNRAKRQRQKERKNDQKKDKFDKIGLLKDYYNPSPITIFDVELKPRSKSGE